MSDEGQIYLYSANQQVRYARPSVWRHSSSRHVMKQRRSILRSHRDSVLGKPSSKTQTHRSTFGRTRTRQNQGTDYRRIWVIRGETLQIERLIDECNLWGRTNDLCGRVAVMSIALACIQDSTQKCSSTGKNCA